MLGYDPTFTIVHSPNGLTRFFVHGLEIKDVVSFDYETTYSQDGEITTITMQLAGARVGSEREPTINETILQERKKAAREALNFAHGNWGSK